MGKEQDEDNQGHIPLDVLPPMRTHLLIAYSVANSPMD
jgi:hypothetical protein